MTAVGSLTRTSRGSRVARLFAVLALLGLVAQAGALHAHPLGGGPQGEAPVVDAADGPADLASASHDPSRCHLCRNAKSDRVLPRSARGPGLAPLVRTRLAVPEPGSLQAAALLASHAPRGPPARS